jgi:hypothetical protein
MPEALHHPLLRAVERQKASVDAAIGEATKAQEEQQRQAAVDAAGRTVQKGQ